MSSLTKVWTEDKIRTIIRAIDKKTGLHGGDLPIKLRSHGSALGYYRIVGDKMFGFTPKFFNNPNTKEAEAIDVIRHEYAHYYVDITGIKRFFVRKGSSRNHNTDWKWACKMVGADPNSFHRPEIFKDINWTPEEAELIYAGADIKEFDILGYLEKWHQIPADDVEVERMNSRIKERNVNRFYEAGDEILHRKRGFGVVKEAIPYNYFKQKVYVCFEDGMEGVFLSDELCKVVGGVVIAYS